MRNDKDWSYFRFEIGNYEPDYFDDPKNFKPYQPETKKLVWYVFNEEQGKIVPINIFEYNWVFLEELLTAKKKYSNDFNKFADHVHRWLSHEYRSRTEYETIITSWPPIVDIEELNRMADEREEYEQKYGKLYRQIINLPIAFKMDVYTQVMMNWDRFIEYIWNNKHLITKKNLGLN